MILCALRTCFCNTHSDWLELSLAASSCKHVITKNRANTTKGKWIVTFGWQKLLDKHKLHFTETVYPQPQDGVFFTHKDKMNLLQYFCTLICLDDYYIYMGWTDYNLFIKIYNTYYNICIFLYFLCKAKLIVDEFCFSKGER